MSKTEIVTPETERQRPEELRVHDKRANPATFTDLVHVSVFSEGRMIYSGTMQSGQVLRAYGPL